MEGEAVKLKRFDKAFKVQVVKMVTEEGQKAPKKGNRHLFSIVHE